MVNSKKSFFSVCFQDIQKYFQQYIMKFNAFLSFSLYSIVSSLNSSEDFSFTSKCVTKMLQNVPHQENDFVHIIPLAEMNKQFFLSILLELNRPVIIAEKLLNSFSELRPMEPSAHFIYVDNLENFKTGFAKLNTTHQNWHPSSKWIIYFQSGHVGENITNTVARILKKAHVYDFEVLIYDHSKATVSISTWYPFSVANKCRRYFNITQIGICQPRNTTVKMVSKIEKIPKRLPKDCIFKVCGFHWPPYAYEDPKTMKRASNKTVKYSVNFVGGYHINTVQALAFRYNAQVQYVAVEEGSRWGMALDNGTWTGALGALQSSKAEAAIGGALQTMARFSVFDCSSTFNPLFMKFFVPLPDKLPHWKSLLDIFSPSLWIFLVTVYICTPVLVRFVSTLSPVDEKRCFKQVITCFFTLWPIAVGSCAHCIPKSLTVRISLHILIIYK